MSSAVTATRERRRPVQAVVRPWLAVRRLHAVAAGSALVQAAPAAPRRAAPWAERTPLLLGMVVVAAAALAAVAPAELLQYRRDAVLAGELWRVLTCHWVHWSFEHLRWDAVAGAALVLACGADFRRAGAALLASSVAIPLALVVLQPGLDTYRGLSGLDSALFVVAAGALLAGERSARVATRWGRPALLARRASRAIARLDAAVRVAGAVALAGFAAKVVWELATGTTFFVDAAASGFQPVPLAHLVGGLCGALALRWLR